MGGEAATEEDSSGVSNFGDMFSRYSEINRLRTSSSFTARSVSCSGGFCVSGYSEHPLAGFSTKGSSEEVEEQEAVEEEEAKGTLGWDSASASKDEGKKLSGTSWLALSFGALKKSLWVWLLARILGEEDGKKEAFVAETEEEERRAAVAVEAAIVVVEGSANNSCGCCGRKGGEENKLAFICCSSNSVFGRVWNCEEQVVVEPLVLVIVLAAVEAVLDMVDNIDISLQPSS